MHLLEPSNHFSLTVFLNLVVKWYAHFEKDICWVQMANASNAYHLPTRFDNTDYAYTRQVVNPVDCVPGCHYYILHDPIANRLEEYINACIRKTYKFKGIVFQTRDRLAEYNASMAFAHSSLFVSADLDTLVIEKFTDWRLTETRVLNVWSAAQNAFVHPVRLAPCFDAKTHNNARVFSVFAESFAPVVQYEPMLAGSHIHILQEFLAKINLGYGRHDAFTAVPANASEYLGRFYPGKIAYDGVYRSTIVNRNRIGFVVPKKRIRINITNVVEVFQWELWMCTFALYVAICAYLVVEKHLGERRRERITLPVKQFFMQPLSAHEIAGGRRVKFVLALLFFFVSWLSILFNYGVLKSLMTPKYENDIRTWEDMDRANLPLYWHRNPMQYNGNNSVAVSNVLSRWVQDKTILEDRQKSIQMHYISDNGLSSLLAQHYDLTNEHVTSLDNLYDTMDEYIDMQWNALQYMGELNKLIRSTQESGLMARWEWEAFLLTAKVSSILEYLDKNSGHATTVQLTIDHLFGVFCGLLIGLWLATIVFFIECYIFG